MLLCNGFGMYFWYVLCSLTSEDFFCFVSNAAQAVCEESDQVLHKSTATSFLTQSHLLVYKREDYGGDS